MVELDENKLKSKGWTNEEIKKTNSIIYDQEKRDKYKSYYKRMNLLSFWSISIIITISNLLVSIVLIPFLLILPSLILYPIIIVLALIFGTLYNITLVNVEYLDTHKKIIGGIVIPLTALLNLFLITVVANSISNSFFFIHHDPIIVSSIYVLTFMVPYLVFVSFNKKNINFK